jgi:hypothetical protein
MDSIGINDFVRRQIKESRFSHFDGTFEELLELVKLNFHNQKQGYREGVVLVSVPSDRFFTSMIEINKDSEIEVKMIKRRENEDYAPIKIVKNASKIPAKYTDIILYRRDVLLENNENTTNEEWEIISINSSIVENTPMHPMTMARNMLEKEGGTKGEYTGKQFAESIWFWKDYAMYEPVLEVNNE